MLRIECESCHAPYQVDERRVPPQGLKMRCPKCGHTFSVSTTGATTTAPASARAPAPAPAAPNKMKMTMVGLGSGGDGANADLPAMKAAALPKAPPLPPKPAAPAPAPGPAPTVNADADLPVARVDLPATRGAAPRPAPPRPGAVPPRPAPPRPIAAKPAPAPAPAPAAAPPARAPQAPTLDATGFGDLDLPAARDKQSSLPAALGNLGDLDLPAARARAAAPTPPARPASPAASPAPAPAAPAFGEIDLPAVAASLPTAKAKPAEMTFDLDLPHPKVAAAKPSARDDLELDLGPPAADLPAPLPALPTLAASLPAKKQEPAFGEIDLPSLDSSLPQVAGTLPAIANVLPSVGQQLPEIAHKEALDFGEVDLGPLGAVNPPEPPPPPPPLAPQLPPLTSTLMMGSSPVVSSPPIKESAFAELDLSGADLKSLPPSHPPPQAAPPPVPTRAANALTFGEVDLGAQAPIGSSASEASIGTELDQAPPTPPPHSGGGGGDELALPEAPGRPSGAPVGGGELSLPIQTGTRRPQHEVEDEPSRAPRIFFLLLVLVLAGGGALQVTKHGAFGYLTIGDAIHAKDYKARTVAASNAARTRAAKDVFPETRGAVDDLLAAHWKMPRATGLSAYAAFAEFAYETRFGGDVERNAKAKLLVGELVTLQDVQYLNVALAAQDAAAGQDDKARKELDAASKRDAGDPIQRDIALLRGEVELAAKDPKAARTAFEAAIKLGASAQAHYGLARVASMGRDWPTLASECDQVLAASPHHPGALLLRAMQRYTAKSDDTNALADLAEIADGPAKPLASTQEIAQAFANRGQIFLSSGRAGDARTAFEGALKIDPRNVDALVGTRHGALPRESLHRGAHAIRHGAPGEARRRDGDRLRRAREDQARALEGRKRSARRRAHEIPEVDAHRVRARAGRGGARQHGGRGERFSVRRSISRTRKIRIRSSRTSRWRRCWSVTIATRTRRP